MPVRLALAALAVLLAFGVLAAEPPAFRLPADVRPLRYALELEVVPGEPRAKGEITIEFETDVRRDVLWLNADALDLARATVDGTSRDVKLLTGFEQFAGFAFDPPLEPGRHSLAISYSAAQVRNASRGIFTLEDRGAWYSMTHFEPIAARRVFPCFDEPGFKTPWQLTLRVPRDLVAVANTAVVAETPDTDGMKRVRFAPTRPLPTYLVAFAVGPWQFVDLGRPGMSRAPTRIVVPAGRGGDVAYVASAYPQLFDRIERYYGIPYPYDKLDHIAIPLTVGFAEENAGLITYGLPYMTPPQNVATARFRRVTASVGAHEIAHQWFGDLVTPAWWDDVWLKESFANFVSDKTVDRWQPDWHRGAARVEARANAIDADLLASARRVREPVNSRGDIFAAYDPITYDKGATVLGMFEAWIGEEPFRRGVKSYLDAHKDGSATTADLLDALTRSSRQPVAPAFETFLNQNGVPRVQVKLACDNKGASLMLTQTRLTTVTASAADFAAQKWQIPVCARVGTGGASTRQVCTLMREASQSVPLGRSCPAFVVANAGGRGYYVADYRDATLERLAARRASLSVPEFASFLDDLRSLVRAGTVSSSTVLQWIRYGAASPDRNVVRAAVDLAAFEADTVMSSSYAVPRYATFVREVFGPRARALGFVPKPGESDDDQLLRRNLLMFVAPYEPELIGEARRLALAWIADRKAVDPGLVDVVLMTAARAGDSTLLDAMLAAAKSTPDRLERRYLYMALLSFGEPSLAKKGLGILLDPAFDARETWTALYGAHQWNPARREPYDFIVANFDALTPTVSPDTPGYWPFYARGLCSASDAAAAEAFWKPRAEKYPGVTRQLATTVEAITLCARLQETGS